jgi:hypothetical protein
MRRSQRLCRDRVTAQRVLVKGQREPSCELKRVLLVSDLGIIQEVINRRYRKGELLVDGQSQRAGAGGGEGARVVPGYIGQKLFVELEFAPFPRVRLGQCRSDQMKSELLNVSRCVELLVFVVQIGRDIELGVLSFE